MLVRRWVVGWGRRSRLWAIPGAVPAWWLPLPWPLLLPPQLLPSSMPPHPPGAEGHWGDIGRCWAPGGVDWQLLLLLLS